MKRITNSSSYSIFCLFLFNRKKLLPQRNKAKVMPLLLHSRGHIRRWNQIHTLTLETHFKHKMFHAFHGIRLVFRFVCIHFFSIFIWIYLLFNWFYRFLWINNKKNHSSFCIHLSNFILQLLFEIQHLA